MKNIQPADPFLRHEFLKWYHVASVGQALQAVESSYLKSNLKLAYRQKTLQIGRLGSESRYIDSDFIGDYVLVDKRDHEASRPSFRPPPALCPLPPKASIPCYCRMCSNSFQIDIKSCER
jgi:hypothetical protein